MTTLPDEELGEFAETMLQVARELDPHGASAPRVTELTGTESLVMRWVDRNPGTSPSVTAEATGLQRSNLSAVLRELERKAMIERRASPADGRHVSLHPTQLARQNIEVLRAWWSERLRDALPAGITDDDVADTAALLSQIRDGLRGR